MDSSIFNVDAKKTVFRMFTYGLYALTVYDLPKGHAATINWSPKVRLIFLS